jgi:FkbM family methyltransferase
LGNVEIVGRGFSDVAGMVTFVLPLQASGAINAGLAHAAGRGGDSDPSQYVEVEVEMVRLDDLDVQGDVSFLKCDIEGAELAALRGGEDLLRRHAPTLLLEVDPAFLSGYGLSPADVFGYLGGLGYGPPHRWHDGRLREASGAEVVGNLVLPHERRESRLRGVS